MTGQTCRVCGDTSDHPDFETRDLMLGSGQAFRYFQCGACGCLQICDIPLDMWPYYPPSYYSLEAGRPDAPVKRAVKRARDRFEVFGTGLLGRLVDRCAPSIYMRGLRVPGIRPSSRVLDIGCGAGRNTVALGDIGFTDATGVDPYIDADIRYPNGVTVRKGALADLRGHWDVIYFHHSFEHVPDPYATLCTAAGLLAPSGAVVISMPVVPCEAWERYGVNWSGLDAPRHLHVHSLESMRFLCTRTGLRMERVDFNSNAMQFWASEQNQKGIGLYAPNSYMVNPRASGWTASRIRAFERQARRLNAEGRGDQAVFLLRHDV